jgi:hypothetical protein
MVYGAKKSNIIDTNDPSQIIEKVVFDGNQICIPSQNIGNIQTCAITFIDYFGNESVATIVNLPVEITNN